MMQKIRVHGTMTPHDFREWGGVTTIFSCRTNVLLNVVIHHSGIGLSATISSCVKNRGTTVPPEL